MQYKLFSVRHKLSIIGTTLNEIMMLNLSRTENKLYSVQCVFTTFSLFLYDPSFIYVLSTQTDYYFRITIFII